MKKETVKNQLVIKYRHGSRDRINFPANKVEMSERLDSLKRNRRKILYSGPADVNVKFQD